MSTLDVDARRLGASGGRTDVVDGARRGAWTGAAGLSGVVLQLGLIVGLIHAFRIEESFGLTRITPVLLGGFVLQLLLPSRARAAWFLFLGLAAIAVVFGPLYGVAMIGVGLVLIGVCHLPIPYVARIGTLLLIGGGLAAVRAGWVERWAALPVPPPPPAVATVVLPILASMFMFRLIIYLYDLRHGQVAGSSWSHRLSYFFMLPNVCFPLFPVVDYRTYIRSYRQSELAPTYQKGLSWMLRGILHLLAYRLVYHHVLPAPTEVGSAAGVMTWILATYLLYLRISGQFHLIVGMLCMFGFDLPETHRLYYLASSFNDFWRRINIYWKDFMKKVFYYPVLMHLNRRGWSTSVSMVGATLVVFLSTWLLHSYQWFWLKGDFPIRLVDILFWGSLGLLVAVNSLRELRTRRRPSVSGASPAAWGAAMRRSLQTVGMFLFIAVLWSLWSSPTLGDWISVAGEFAHGRPAEYVALAALVALAVAAGTAAQMAAARGWRPLTLEAVGPPRRAAIRTALPAAALLATGLLVPAGEGGGGAGVLLASVRSDRLSERDAELADRGYYEDLLDANQFTSSLWRVRSRPSDWTGTSGAGATVEHHDPLNFTLAPSFEGTAKRAPFRTNRWGMADRDYALEKPPGVRRIAFLGASYEEGAGVERHQTLEAVLEDLLNRGRQPSSARYEVLNFAVAAYSLLHQAFLVERSVLAFEPDFLFVAVHSTEDIRLSIHLRKLIKERVPIEDPELRAILARSGAAAEMSDRELEVRVRPILEDVSAWSLRRLGRLAAEGGIRTVAVYVPTTEETAGVDARAFRRLSALAVDAGFTVLSLEGAYEGSAPEDIQLAPWDFHLSAQGHRLLGERLYSLLLEREPALRESTDEVRR